ncbi:hypothetical protein T06_9852 [Trichinella sp. T6]|nr:hypothetical protein T06_9852 [Trichinella sp. T6]
MRQRFDVPIKQRGQRPIREKRDQIVPNRRSLFDRMVATDWIPSLSCASCPLHRIAKSHGKPVCSAPASLLSVSSSESPKSSGTRDKWSNSSSESVSGQIHQELIELQLI